MTFSADDDALIDRLARAWAAADDAEAGTREPDEGGATDARERIWQAATGQLPPAETRELAALAAGDPELAQAWRLARELGAEDVSAARPITTTRFAASWSAPRMLALAAALVLGVGLLFWLPRFDRDSTTEDTVLRSGDRSARIEALLADGAQLPRAAFVLRWSPAADPATRYTARVSTADLRLLAELTGLTQSEVTVSPQALASTPPGTELYWQVEARFPDGLTSSSPVFRVVLVD